MKPEKKSFSDLDLLTGLISGLVPMVHFAPNDYSFEGLSQFIGAVNHLGQVNETNLQSHPVHMHYMKTKLNVKEERKN
jgi:hypothetical protein